MQEENRIVIAGNALQLWLHNRYTAMCDDQGLFGKQLMTNGWKVEDYGSRTTALITRCFF